MIVLDSSSAVEYLVGWPQGEWVELQLAADADVHAPHLLDVEVANALRNLVHRGEVPQRLAREALDDLADLAVTRYPHTELLARIWQLRGSLTAYDAAYVALAEALGAALVTTDSRLARAPGIRAQVVAP